MSIYDVVDGLKYVKQNKKFVYFQAGGLDITVDKLTSGIVIKDRSKTHTFRKDVIHICHIGTTIRFFQKLQELYDTNVTK